MSGLLFLTTDDFQLVQGTKNKIMTHNTRGFSLILFYSTQCVHCKDLIPIFKSPAPVPLDDIEEIDLNIFVPVTEAELPPVIASV